MATKEQWEIFKYLFEREQIRNQKLSERGKVYLSLITLYVGAIGLKVDFWYEKIAVDDSVATLFVIVLVIFLLALCFSVLALGIYRYEYISDPENIIHQFGDEAPPDEIFFDDRIVDIAVATNRNMHQNDRRAKFLKISSWIMVIGVFMHIVAIAAAVSW